MSLVFLYSLVFAAGLTMAVQPAINGTLSLRTGTIEGVLVSFSVGTIILAFIVICFGKGNIKAVTEAPLWELTGGIYGAFFVVAVTYVVPRIGVTTSMIILIASQIIASIVIDHYGLLGMKAIPIDIKKFIGIGLLLAGVFLAA